MAYHALPDAINKKDLKACINLSKAAFLAGKAINISKTTAPHALSYTLTAHFGIPHGHAVSLTLGDFLLLNAKAQPADTLHPLGVHYLHQTTREISSFIDGKNAQEARENLQRLMQKIGLERKLSQLGIIQSHFDFITQNINFERLANHPRKVTPETIQSILTRIA